MSKGTLSGQTGNKVSHQVIANGTPETYLLSCDKGKLDKDAVFCAIDRASATLKLLDLQFNGDDCERLSDETIQNALWGVEGYLDQIKILLEHQ
ncbi:hypothetical protein [Cellvibrio fibrivorans]|uniref:Uncharacterized protein n=1 Tax=Cellvibrio fibrivorans TaxID=126350 RepID=A0ABU1V3S4_9GAMM|nr:hypothetical protein [Cellvibrio fibrivorans]MDR7092102.1 hypothetical protein [Cellvibrio fibrivorans]